VQQSQAVIQLPDWKAAAAGFVKACQPNEAWLSIHWLLHWQLFKKSDTALAEEGIYVDEMAEALFQPIASRLQPCTFSLTPSGLMEIFNHQQTIAVCIHHTFLSYTVLT
jgi:hypothetical protein